MRRMLIDLRSTLRQLKNSPGFTLVAVVILALGIGATTAIYTLLDQALLRSLPVRNPERLVQLRAYGGWNGRTSLYGGSAEDAFSYPMYLDLRDRNKVFSGVLATAPAQVGIQWNKQPELAAAELVSGNYFDVLGVRPALGRMLLPSDNLAQNASPVVVLSFAYWQRRFGADPHILNQIIGVNGRPFTVVGVAVSGFHSVVPGNTPAIFAPMMMKGQITPGDNDLTKHDSRWLNIIARLKPGMTVRQAQAGIQPLWHSLRAVEFQSGGNHAADFREMFVDHTYVTLEPAARGYTAFRADALRTPLLIVMFMAGLVLLMACANVASLMLVRGAGRVREMSVRYALGAKRSQVVQQLLIEGLLLGLAGGGLGLWIAPRVAFLLERRILDQTNGELPFLTHLDWRMMAFTLALSIGVSLLFSVAPALQFWRPDVTPALKQQTSTASGGSLQLQRVAVGVQIGLSVLLLIGAGLFVRTLYSLKSVNVGFATDHLIQFRADPRLAGYAPAQMPALYQRLLDVLGRLPGVRAIGATDSGELQGNSGGSNITIAGYKTNESIDVERTNVSPNYFSTLGVPLLAGRTFTNADHKGTAKVAVVNESFVRRYFGQPRKALGYSFAFGAGDQVRPDIQIVGVVQDAKHTSLQGGILPSVFIPFTQADDLGAMWLYIRTWQAPELAMETIRKSMLNLDSKLVLDSLETVADQINDDLDTQRTIALLAICFGVLALLISAVGLYGVLSYATARRTREIGVRMALGAGRASIARMVLMDVLRLVAISVAIALPVAWGMTRWVRDELYGVSGHDPLTMAAVVAAVVVIALVAAILPVRRAVGVDPMTALRYE